MKIKLKVKGKEQKSKQTVQLKKSVKKVNEVIEEERVNDSKWERDLELIKIESDLKNVIIGIIKESEESLHAEMLSRFESALSNLRKDGVSWKADYVEYTLSDIAKKGIKAIGNEGWRFAFVMESDKGNKYVFWKPRK